MKLHFRGIEVPALGSPRDIVYRNYLIHENRLEAKKHQMLLLITMGSALISESGARSEWDRQAKAAFEDYVLLMFGEEVSPRAKEEADLLKFYEEKIKESKPVIRGSSSKGDLRVENLPEL